MTPTPTLLERLCDFAAALEWRDLPAPTRRLARAQLLGWLGSVAAGRVTDEAPGILRVAGQLGRGEPVALWPEATPQLAPLGAAYAGAALSCAHDYDDYLLMAHTGHSACGVAWITALRDGNSLAEALTAAVAANEVMGRLGAACLLGPQNGQLWTFVHLAGAVLAGGRLEGRSARSLARALSTAFYQPPMALWTGFGASSAKLLSAATPTLIGLLALAHEAEGMTGALDALEGPGGFFSRFSFLPLEALFEDLGARWVTDTLSVKAVPGCAYVSAPIAGALDCVRQFAARHDRPLHPSDVASVTVAAGPMTIGMERLLGALTAASPLESVAVNFSVPFSVALALVHGRVAAEDLTAASLQAWEPALRELAANVSLSLDAAHTEAAIRRVGAASGVLRALRRHGPAAALRGLAAALRATPLARGGAEVALGPALRGVTGLVGALLKPGSDAAAESFAFAFGANVTLHTTRGERYAAAFEVPPGAAGNGVEAVCRTARDKFVRESRRFAPDAPLDALAEAVLAGEWDERPVRDLAQAR